jgi:hypothetical protein
MQSLRFTGREDALEWIEASLLGKCPLNCRNNCHTVNLYGPGGIGKSQIVLAFASRFYDRFSSVVWIPAQTRAAIEHEYLEIMRTLRSPTLELGGEGRVHKAFYSTMEWLNSSRNNDWLLIFDDFDLSATPNILELIRSTACNHGHVIITSRASADLPFLKTYRVGPLRADESRALLKSSLGPTHPYDAYPQSNHGLRIATHSA